MALVAAVNFRGVGESVKANVVLTLVELSGLLMIIFIGLYAVTQGNADFSRVVVFESPSDKSTFFAITAATSLAFFAMVGFEDSVNMAEECHNPIRDFPRMMLTGLGVTGVIYVLVSITAVALVPVGDLTDPDKGQALTQVVAAGAPDFPFDTIFPFIGMFAVANSALINMLMASRLLYGMANQDVLPRVLRQGAPDAAYAVGLDPLHDRDLLRPDHLRRPRHGLRRGRHVGRPAGWHDRAAAAVRVHHRQHRGAGPAQAARRPRPLHGADLAALPRRGRRARSWPARGRAATSSRSSTRSPAACWPSASCCGRSPGSTNRGVRAKKTGFRDIEHLEK